MNELLRMSDRLSIPEDDLIVVNKAEMMKSGVYTPQGRLFEVLGIRGKHRVVREIACNTVVVGGAIRALENLLGVDANWSSEIVRGSSSANRPTLCLFGVGNGGASEQFGSVVAPKTWQYELKNPIPLRRTTASTPSGSESAKYFGKVFEASANNWYFKEFNETPVIKTCLKNSSNPDADGTEVTSRITDEQGANGIETFAEIQIKLNTSDVREYYENMGSTISARYNEIGFYVGAKVGNEYTNVRLYSTVTFNNYDVSTPVSRTLVYRVYSLL